MKNVKRIALLAWWVVVAGAACTKAGTTPTDAGTTSTDAGTTPTDAGAIGPGPTPTMVCPVGDAGYGPTAKTDVDATSIPAPLSPIPEIAPDPLCVDGQEYQFLQGDDFAQETPAQLTRYTTSWEINQYEYNGATTNWLWSDQYSGIGRRNDFGAGDTYMVHIDDSNRLNSYPAPWVNDVCPRPGVQIVGTPPNSYLLIRAVSVPAEHMDDPALNGAHWLTGALQGNKFTFGYTESTVTMPDNDGAWPACWSLQVPGGGGFDGTGTGPTNYWELDTFEKFGNLLGSDTVQQTCNSGRSDSVQVARPTTPGSTTTWHTYGQLWVAPKDGNPAFIVFYVDRKPTSTLLSPTGVGDMNANVNLQMGLPGSFVGTPDPTKVAELKLKNYFTWQASGRSCSATAQAHPIPLPPPPPPPMTPPAVAGNIVPQLQPYPPPVLTNTSLLQLPNTPAAGSLVVAGGISADATCPTGFTSTSYADALLCTGIVGQNGIVASNRYNVGGAGLDRSFIFNVTQVTSVTINPSTGTGWQSDPKPQLTRTQTVTSPNGLFLAFGYALTDSPRYTTSANYSANISFNTLLSTPADASYGRTLSVMEGSVDPSTAPGSAPSFTGSYGWAGTPSSVGNDLLPEIFTVMVH